MRTVDPESKTQRAIAMVLAGITPYRAAKHLGIHASNITRGMVAYRRRLDAQVASGEIACCPTCGTPLAGVD